MTFVSREASLGRFTKCVVPSQSCSLSQSNQTLPALGPGPQFQSCHLHDLLASGQQHCRSTSLGLGFLMCKMGKATVGPFEDEGGQLRPLARSGAAHGAHPPAWLMLEPVFAFPAPRLIQCLLCAAFVTGVSFSQISSLTQPFHIYLFFVFCSFILHMWIWNIAYKAGSGFHVKVSEQIYIYLLVTRRDREGTRGLTFARCFQYQAPRHGTPVL